MLFFRLRPADEAPAGQVVRFEGINPEDLDRNRRRLFAVLSRHENPESAPLAATT